MKRRFRDEYVGAGLGDARRSERLTELGMALAEWPGASLPEALGDGAELEAAYRFLGNEAVDAREILEPHYRESTARCGERGTVVVALSVLETIPPVFLKTIPPASSRDRGEFKDL